MKSSFIFLFVIITPFAFAQKSSPEVLNAAGGFFKNNDFSVAYSIGEFAITYLTSPTGGISQGFLQAETLIINASEEEIDNSVLYFPNPVKDKLQIRSSVRRVSEAQVFDILGRNNSRIPLQGEMLDLTKIPQGIYLLRLLDFKQQLIRVIRIEKL